MKILNIRRCSILTQFAELEQKAIRLELETVFPVPGISWNLLDPGITKQCAQNCLDFYAPNPDGGIEKGEGKD